MPDRTLSDVQIDHYYRGNEAFGGCYCKDQVRRKSPQGKFWVLNMDDSTDPRGGTHWVLVFDCRPDICIYADSYGVSPPPVIAAFLKRSKKPVLYTKDDYQGMNSTACGYFCLYMADQLLAGIARPLPQELRELFEQELRPGQFTRNEEVVTTEKIMGKRPK
jgi:hypothetical protein